MQGAFLRIWERDDLGTNDTTANDIPMISNAYDAQESDAHPEGYVGKDNIPEICDVPTGLHEPILVGNTLYLAGYNTGARILKLTGDSIAVRAYCRTESFLSNDTADAHFYMRPDMIMYAKGFYRYVPDQNRPGITYGSDPYNGMWIIRYFDCDSAIVDTLKHIAFQDRIVIGPPEPGKPMAFHFGPGGAVIADSAVVEFADDATLSWNSEDSLVVNGDLYLGAIHCDSTQYGAPRNRIFVGNGGTVYLGGMEKTITGRLNLHVGPGGRAVILAGTTLQLVDTSMFLIEGDLTVESCVLSDGCHFIARDDGMITIDTAADVTGLLDCTIADKRSLLKLNAFCVLRMQRGGAINVYGRIETPVSITDPPVWCRVQSMHAYQNSMCQPGDEWNGILLYGNWHGDTFENAFIHHGYPGVWVYSANPLIRRCEFSNNFVGCRITEGRARLEHNRFEKNEYIGLDMQLHDTQESMENRMNHNFHYGLYLYGCADTWHDNRLDSNITGAYVTDYSDIYLNEWESWSPSTTCDTTRGNSIRHNHTGMCVVGYSSAESHCDNSVHHNYSANPLDAQDIVVYSWSRAVGWGNYPDTAAVTPDAIRFVKGRDAIAQWDDPSDSLLSPSTDPVLRKSALQSPFNSALARGRASTRQGFYQAAQTDFALAANLAATRDEFITALQAWRRMVNTADRDSLKGAPGYRSAYWTALASVLAGKADYADSLWMRNIAAEILLTERIKRRDTTGLSSSMQALANGNPDDAVVRRTHLRHVVYDECVRGDHGAALSRCQSLQSAWPQSREALYAKILLRQHLDSMDIASLAKLPLEQGTETERHIVQTRGLLIEGPWPTPQRDEAFLRVWSDEAVVVDRSVYDMRGVCLRRDQGITLREGWNGMALRLDGLASGAYVLVLERYDRRWTVALNVVRD